LAGKFEILSTHNLLCRKLAELSVRNLSEIWSVYEKLQLCFVCFSTDDAANRWS